jgi:hypothetical protein
LIIPNDPTLVFKQEYFTMQVPSRLSMKKGGNDRSRSRNKTVLLMMSKSKERVGVEEDDDDSDGEIISKIVEDMGSTMDRKIN